MQLALVLQTEIGYKALVHPYRSHTSCLEPHHDFSDPTKSSRTIARQSQHLQSRPLGCHTGLATPKIYPACRSANYLAATTSTTSITCGVPNLFKRMVILSERFSSGVFVMKLGDMEFGSVLLGLGIKLLSKLVLGDSVTALGKRSWLTELQRSRAV